MYTKSFSYTRLWWRESSRLRPSRMEMDFSMADRTTSSGEMRSMQAFWRDIRHAARGLRKSPGFTLVVLLTLGLGIGANTAIFSLMDQVLLRSLPVHDPVGSSCCSTGPGAFQGRTFNDADLLLPDVQGFSRPERGLLGRARALSDGVTIVWQGQSERVQRRARHRQLLRRPRRPRRRSAACSTPADDRTPGAHPVAVLSYGFWQRRFGGDPAVAEPDDHGQRPPDDDRRRHRRRVQRHRRSARAPTSSCR